MLKARKIAANIIFCTIVICASFCIIPEQALAGTIYITHYDYDAGHNISATNESGPYSSFASAFIGLQPNSILKCDGLFQEDGLVFPSNANYITIRPSLETSVCTLERLNSGARCMSFGIPDPMNVPQIVSIEGFTIRNYYSSSGNGAVFFINTPGNSTTTEVDLVLRKCVFFNNQTSSGAYRGGVVGIDYGSKHKVYAENCAFVRNYVGQYGGVSFGGRWVTKNCTFVSNEAGTSGAIYYTNDYISSWVASSDVYEDNKSPATAVYKLFNADDVSLRQCYVQSNAWYPLYNINCISKEANIGSRDLSSPLFGRPMQRSSLIDSGVTIPSITDDIVDYVRPHGRGYDIGAFEFQGPSIKLISPTGPTLEAIPSLTITAESTYRITWEVFDQYGLAADGITISFSSNEGATWTVVADSIPNVYYWDWPVPAYTSTKCMISVEAVNTSGEGNYAMSDRTFTIVRPGNVYVSNSGDDDNNIGTVDQPFRTIQKGLNSAAEGATVYLFSGLYTGDKNVRLDWPPRNNITLKASTETSLCTIDALSNGRIFANMGRITGTIFLDRLNVTIEAITLQNGATLDGGACMKLQNLAKVFLKNVTVKHCKNSDTFQGGAFHGELGVGGLYPTIYAESCIFITNEAYQDYYTGLGGVSYYCNWKAKQCLFIYNSAGDQGGVAYGGNTFEADNCVFLNNRCYYEGGVASSITKFITRNSIFWYNRSYSTTYYSFNATGVINITTEYCDFQYRPLDFSVVPEIYWGKGNITFEPRFVSTSEPYDFRLKEISPCIDSGTWESGVLPTDMAGNFRPHGFTADMGAYEFQGPSVSLISPVGGEIFNPGDPVPIIWKIDDEYGLLSPGPCITVEYTTNEGTTWQTIVQSSESDLDGTVYWTAPHILLYNKFIIRIKAVNSSSEANYDLSMPFSLLLRDVYVTTSGNDGYHGTIDSPFRTIQRALNCVDESGTINLGTGIYTGTNNRNLIWPKLDQITLKASDETSLCTIDAQNAGIIVATFESNTLTIESITMKNGFTTEGYGYGGCMKLLPGRRLFLIGCTVDNCSSEIVSFNAYGGAFYGITPPGGSEYNYARIYAENSIFSNNVASHGGVFYWCNIKATNCVFKNNKAFYITTDSGGGVAYLNTYTTFEAMNCDFVNNTAWHTEGATKLTDGPVGCYGRWKIKNSIIWYNNYGISGLLDLYNGPFANVISSNCTVEYSCIQPNFDLTDTGKYWIWKGRGTITAEPLFADPNTDLHLLNGSPCLDSGTKEGAPSRDLDGRSRYYGFGVDMGVYEAVFPRVRVIAPNGGERYSPGDPILISWFVTADYGLSSPDPIKVRYNRDGGPWLDIVASSEPVGAVYWSAPANLSNNYLISVEATDTSGEVGYDKSDAPFGILGSQVYIAPSPVGNDNTGDGTAGLPFRTIQKGLNSVMPGGTVYMFGGTYPGTTPGNLDVIWPNLNNITLKSSLEGVVCVVDALALGRIINIVNPGIELSIEGITMKGGKAVNGGGLSLSSTNAILHLTNVIMYHCTAEGITTSEGGAVYSASSTNKVNAVNSIFAGNIAVNSGAAAGGEWKAVNCVFADNTAKGTSPNGKGGVAKTGNWTGTNCIFWGNTAITADVCVFDTAISPAPLFDYTDVQTNGCKPFSLFTVSHDISVEPNFVSSREPYNFQLQYYSPLIDRGTGGFSAPQVPNFDINYATRPRGLGYDMGAYEFSGFTVSVIYPNGGERFDPGSNMTITYNVSDENGLPAAPISIYFSPTPEIWQVVTQDAVNTGIFTWELPSSTSYTCRISVEAVNLSAIRRRDISDTVFFVSLPITGIVTNENSHRTYPTISAALSDVTAPDPLHDGDVIQCSGSFNENLIWPNKNITLRGFGMPILHPTTGRAIQVGTLTPKPNITIEGLIIENGSYTGRGGGINFETSGLRLWLNGVWFRSNTAKGTSGNGGAVYALGCTVEARNCIFSNNRTESTTLGGGAMYGGDWKLWNCTFFGNTAGILSGGVAYDFATWEARNSIFWDNSNPIFYKSVPVYPSIKYSDIQSAGSVWPYAGSGNISVEPKFISEIEGVNQDLMLQDDSPCIDSGTFEGAMPTDIRGITRPQPSATLLFDMGAYEQVAFGSSAPSIEAIYVNGVRFNSGDIISYNVGMTVFCISKNGLDHMDIYVDGSAVPIPFSMTSGTPQMGMWETAFTLPPQSDTIRTHTFKFKLTDSSALESEKILTATTMAGTVQVIGTPLNYPNPFKPLSSNSDVNTTNIQYTLSKDAPVTVLIYDITGHEVKRIVSSAGANGGRAGINSVQWNGQSLFGETVGNGMYMYKLISGNRVIGSGKMVVFD